MTNHWQVSTTGHGESITKVVLAHAVTAGLRCGLGPAEAASQALGHMHERVGGAGGVIVVDNQGRWAGQRPSVGGGYCICLKLHRYSAQFTTQRMPWAAISKGTLEHGFLPGECLTETL